MKKKIGKKHCSVKKKIQNLYLFLFWCYMIEKTEKHWSRQFLNAVEREPFPTRVLNPKACEVQGCSPGGGFGGAKPPTHKKKIRQKKKKIVWNVCTFFYKSDEKKCWTLFFTIFFQIYFFFINFFSALKSSETYAKKILWPNIFMILWSAYP